MRWYSNLKIRYKLLFTFGIPVILLVVLAVLAVVQLGNVDKKYNNLITTSMWRQNNISIAIADMQKLRYINSIKDYLIKINADENEFSTLQKKFDELAEQFINNLNSYSANVSMDTNLPESEKQKRIEYINGTLNLFINEYQAKTRELDGYRYVDEQETDRIKGEIFDAGNVISERLDTFYRFITFMVQEISADTSANSKKAIILLINMTIVLVILSFLVSRYLGRRIKKPITKMMNAMQEISKGNLSYPIRSDNNDELGILANQMGDMIDNISEMNKVMTVMANIDSMVVVTDLDHNLRYMNQSCADAYGLDINVCIGQKCHKAIRGLDEPCSICQMTQLLQQKDSFPTCDYEFLYDEKLNAWVGGKSAIIRWVDGSMVYMQSIKNETERKKNQELLSEAKKEAEEALASKSAFFANMSHEIRTPMNAVLGMSELLLQENLSKKQLKYAKDIKMSAGALLNIINDILDISKLQAGKLQLIPVHYDFNAMIDNIGSIVQFLVDDSRKGIKFNLLMRKHEHVCLYGDDMRLRQILLNLLSNAIKFTEKGYVQLAVKFTDNTLQLTVTDTGMGIPAESIPTLFDAFEQVDLVKNRNKKGTGLGLTITKAIIEMMGGIIKVESEYGKGTNFFVELPKHLGDPALVEQINDNDVAICAPDAKILVVDDNEINLYVACGLLQFFNIIADTASSGKEAIEMIQKNKYDIVFMDHQMPEWSGVETTRLIRELGIDVPIIALTASAAIGSKEVMLESGMNDYLWKPIVKNELVHMLQKWLPAEKLLEPPQKHTIIKAGDDEDAKKCDIWGKLRQIEGLDVQAGLNKINGQRDVYENTLKLVVKDIEKCIKNLVEFSSANDMHEFCIAVHGMKSALANVGAMELSSKAFTLEKASYEKNTCFCIENLPPFLTGMNELSEKIKSAMMIMDDAELFKKAA
jgi:signal transduction histidine kinase/CheY-like chemotaxis protein/HAMP domain-containing protein/HPt (histidine-containing phosphotransfer) domain-containing protein